MNKNLSNIAIFWTLGYGLTNLFKQLLAKVVLNTTQGIDKLLSWTSSNLIKKILGFGVPAMRIIDWYTFFGVLVAIAVLFILYLQGKILFKYDKKMVKVGFKAMFVAFFPMWIWCFVLSGAVGHGFYVQNYMPFIVAFFYMVVSGMRLTDKAKIMQKSV